MNEHGRMGATRRACLTMRRVLFQMRMETLRRKGDKQRRRGAA